MDRPLATGDVVKDFALREIGADERAGAEHRLSDYRGRVVVVTVWATWCAPCVDEMPVLEELARTYDGRVAFFTLTHDLRPKVAAFLSRRAPSDLVHLYDSKRLAEYLGTSGIPSTFVIDQDGRLATMLPGGTDIEQRLGETLEELLVRDAQARIPRTTASTSSSS